MYVSTTIYTEPELKPRFRTKNVQLPAYGTCVYGRVLNPTIPARTVNYFVVYGASLIRRPGAAVGKYLQSLTRRARVVVWRSRISDARVIDARISNARTLRV